MMSIEENALETYRQALIAAGMSVKLSHPLSAATTFRIGGPADIFVEASSAEQTATAVLLARDSGLPLTCLGGDSNILASDIGCDGIVLSAAVRGITFEGTTAIVGAGESWDDFVKASAESGLAGITAMSGIPGSVGGAIAGNAGAYGECVSDRLIDVRVVDQDGTIATIPASAIEFSYRHSSLKETKQVIVEARFALDESDPLELVSRREDILATRRGKHPDHTLATAGSFFRNIDAADERARVRSRLELPDDGRRIAAGLLLDHAGARGMSVGDASVYEKHANIIVNRGHARASDVIELSNGMRDAVAQRFDILLTPEVRWIGRPQPGIDAWMGE